MKERKKNTEKKNYNKLHYGEKTLAYYSLSNSGLNQGYLWAKGPSER